MTMSREEVDAALRQAIINHAIAMGTADPKAEMLNHYAVVAHWMPVEAGDESESVYTLHTYDQTTPRHIVMGLLTEGIMQLENWE